MPSVISCPSCQKQLKVPDELIGRAVKCPGCKETFTAQIGSPSAPVQEEIAEKPRKRPAPPPEEEEEEPPRRPAARRRDDDDEGEDEMDDRPSRRRRRGRPMQPHRGTLILVLGILSLVVFQPLGIFAWIMANTDLKEIDAGRMDPEGRQQTQIGKILGMISTILMAVSLVGGLLFCLLMCLAAGAGGAGGR
jgi:predicted Zn finger-like uncharacterized protein